MFYFSVFLRYQFICVSNESCSLNARFVYCPLIGSTDCMILTWFLHDLVYQFTEFTCNKLTVIEGLAKLITETDPRSSFCDPEAGGSDDAYILSMCNLTSPMTWKRGINVSYRIIHFTNITINFNIIDLYTLQIY